MNGKPIACNKALACLSSSVLVTKVTSKPLTRLISSKLISVKMFCSLIPKVKLPCPSKLLSFRPRKSLTRGKAILTSFSTKFHIGSFLKVTLTPISWFSRNLNVAIAFFDLVLIGF